MVKRCPNRTIDICGIYNHEITSIPIVSAGAVARSQSGDVIVIVHQYAYHLQQGRSIHSLCQLELFATDVNDKSIRTPGGLQHIQSVDGYAFPLSTRDGLRYLGMRPYMEAKFASLPHMIFTSNVDWDPRAMGFGVQDDNN